MQVIRQELLAPLLYKWSSYQANACSLDGCCLCFCNENYNAHIAFYDNNLIELQIKEKDTDEQVFYLHFELRDIKESLESVRLFMSYLDSLHQEEQSTYASIQDYKILLCCTTGLTTSYFAFLMQDALGSTVQIDAVSFNEVENIIDDYDFVLLAPQISYQYPQLKNQYGDKILQIDTLDFATYNVAHVISQIQG